MIRMCGKQHLAIIRKQKTARCTAEDYVQTLSWLYLQTLSTLEDQDEHIV